MMQRSLSVDPTTSHDTSTSCFLLVSLVTCSHRVQSLIRPLGFSSVQPAAPEELFTEPLQPPQVFIYGDYLVASEDLQHLQPTISDGGREMGTN